MGLVVLGFGGASATGAGCNLSVHGENQAGNALQTAINAAHTGWTICIGAGTYPEQIVVSTAGLHLQGAGAAKVSIAPTTGVVNAVDWDSGSNPEAPLVAVVLVNNVSGVSLTGVTVNAAAAAASIAGCSPGIVGVDFQNVSSGTLRSDVVTGAELSPSLLGCQSQTGVYIYTGYYTTGYVPGAAAVTVASTKISAYGKGGIVCDDPGLACTLTGDTVTGIGVTPAIAANGIQVAFGAKGIIRSDTVTGNAYDGVLSAYDWYGTSPNSSVVGYQSSGVLLYQAAAGTEILSSHFALDSIAIAAYQDASDRISGNVIVNSSAYAIVENGLPSTTATIASNIIGNAKYGAIGILVDNGTFRVADNRITNVRATGSQGAEQAVAGPGTYYPSAAPTWVTTAAIQAVSEGGPTVVTIVGNVFSIVSAHVGTASIYSGSVTVRL